MTQHKYEIVPFFQAVKDCTGGNPKVQRKDYLAEGDISVIDQGQDFIAGFTDSDNGYRGGLPLVLFGDHTRTFKYVDFPFALGADGVKALEPLEGFNAKFLHYYFCSVHLPNAGYSRHFKFLKEIGVPKPALPEQRRIVDLLSRAEGIVRLRREAERCAAQLIPALFLDLFGDPATNPMGWPEHRLGDIAEVVSGVTKGRKLGDKQTVEVPYLRVANVQAGHIDLSVLKTIEVLPREVEQLALQRGDVVLTEGGDFDKLGRGALWEHDVTNCIHQNHVFRVRLNQSVALPEFFVTYLQANKAREYFLRCAKRTTNLASINMTQLRALPVVLPSMNAQREFVEQFSATRSIQAQQSAATAKAQAAFDALLARCFDPTTANDIRGAA